MKQALILLIAVLVVSCHKPESKSIELIAYYWSMSEKSKNDTIIPIINCRFYAQINENGNIILNVKDYRKGNRFISFKINDSKGAYKKNRFHDFKSNEKIIKEVFDLIDKANSDTSMIDRKDTTCYIYDGPSISIVGKNNQSKQVRLKFISSRSNLSCLNLYKYLELKSEKNFYNSRIDTTKILQAKEKLIKDIYKKDVGLLPKLKKSIRFIAPVIKKHK